MRYTAEKRKDGSWKIWQHLEGQKRVVCFMSTNDVIDLYESVVPEFKETVLVAGEVFCKHTWVPYKINHSIKLCNKCPAMVKIERLVPRHTKES